MGHAGTMTRHDFHQVVSTELHAMGVEKAHVEVQMSHQKRNRVATAYDHSKYLKEHVATRQAWAGRLDQLRAGAEILPFKAA
jgi:hypothetical protein